MSVCLNFAIFEVHRHYEIIKITVLMVLAIAFFGIAMLLFAYASDSENILFSLFSCRVDLLTAPQNALEMCVLIFICSPPVRHNGRQLSCGVDKPQVAEY